MLNNALRQTGWETAPLTEDNWRTALRDRIAQVNWERVVADARPFLEPNVDVGLLQLENVRRVLE